MLFKHAPIGDIWVNNIHYRKVRPWAPEQFNASLHDQHILCLEIFVHFSDNVWVELNPRKE